MNMPPDNNTIYIGDKPSVFLQDQDINPHKPVPGYVSWVAMGCVLVAFNFWGFWPAVGVFVAGIVVYFIIGMPGMPAVQIRCPHCRASYSAAPDDDTEKPVLRQQGYWDIGCRQCHKPFRLHVDYKKLYPSEN